MKFWRWKVSLETIAHSEDDGGDDDFKKIHWLESRGSVATMNNIMSFVRSHDNAEVIIRNTIRILARKRQSDLLSSIVRNGSDKVPSYSAHVHLFARMPLFTELMECKAEGQKTLNLSKDLILPWPWKAQRYQTLAYIGSDVGRPWEEDRLNHSVSYYHPLDIGIVNGGNHSIAAGIIKGEGKLNARDIYDLTSIYNLFSWDGDSFVHQNIRYPIQDYDMAAIVELGRLLAQPKTRDAE